MKTLIKIQGELKAPKNQLNKFGNYNYRNAEDILEAVKPLLVKYECLLTMHDEMVEVGGRVYVKATADFCHNDFTKVVTAFAREEETKKGMDGSQITGAASSYARKYALNGLFLIDDAKDSDSTNEHNKTEKPEPKEQPKAESKSVEFNPLIKNYQSWVEWFAKDKRSESDKLNEMRTKYRFVIDFTEETQLINDASAFKLTLNK